MGEEVETCQTLGGIPVRNVAQPVIRHGFNIYCLNELGISFKNPGKISPETNVKLENNSH